MVAIQLGDFGFLWRPTVENRATLWALQAQLVKNGQTLYFLDGNHENFRSLYRIRQDEDGLRWLTRSIAHLPRGHRTTFLSGASLAILGGANSVDIHYRTEGVTVWKEESITEADLVRLGDAHADVLLGHDAPTGIPQLEALMARTAHSWPKESLAYAEAGRRMFHRGFMAVKPALFVGGHYHVFLNAVVEFGTGSGAFTARTVILDRDWSPLSESAAILDVDTLHLAVLNAT